MCLLLLRRLLHAVCWWLQVQIYRYDGEEWLNVISRDNALVSMGWTKEETDYLLDMLEQYDLRFVVVADRYNVSQAYLCSRGWIQLEDLVLYCTLPHPAALWWFTQNPRNLGTLQHQTASFCCQCPVPPPPQENLLRVSCCPTLQFPGGPPRVLEDLKDRYYSIARKLMVAREGTDATLLNQHLLRNPYNANQGVCWE